MADVVAAEPPVKIEPVIVTNCSRRRLDLRLAPILVPVLLLIFVQPFKALTDPDYWWHVRTGQFIYQTGTIPRADLYSYTVFGQPWTAHEWLTELLFYVVQHHAGYVGNVVLFGLVGVATAMLVYTNCRRWGVGQIGAVLLMLWASALAEPAFNVRPQVLTAFFVAICVALVTLYKNGRPMALWPLPFLFAIWVNLHGGYVIGLALLGMTVVGEALARKLGRPSAPLRPLLGITAFSVMATLVNPHGPDALVYPMTYLGPGNAIVHYILEWQSPNFHSPAYAVFAASLLLAVYLGVWRRPLGPTEALWSIAFSLLGLDAARHIPLFAVVVMPLLGARLQAEVPALRSSLASWRRPALLVATSLSLLLIVAATTLAQAQKTGLQTGRDPSTTTFPVGAVAYLRAHNVPGNLFNDYGWGGYLIDSLYPQRRVFIDGRIDLYGDAIGSKYDAVINLAPGWQTVFDEYDIRAALVRQNTPLDTVLRASTNWQLVYSDRNEALFVRRGT